MISKRHVFFVAGFDPIDTGSHHDRFLREYRKFGRTWIVGGTVSGILPADAGAGERWRIVTDGSGWSTETIFEPCDWQDIIQAEIARAALWHVPAGIVTFFNFLVTGTAYRYFRAAWRYGIFFLVPFATLVLFTLIAIVAGLVAATGMAPDLISDNAVFLVVAALVFAGLIQWPGRRWRTIQALADWTFARAYLYGRHPAIASRIGQFAERLGDCARRADVDEILIVGHSLGATIAIDMIARALNRDAELARHGPAIALMTIGSTIPKVALHPAATALREAAHQVANLPDVVWTEFQARRDPISFFKFDPVSLRRCDRSAPGVRPQLRLVAIKNMLEPETYARLRWRFMRMHYQFVFANETRAPYDFFLSVCGPASLAELTALPDGAAGVLDADGRYRAAASRQSPGAASPHGGGR